MKGVTTWNIVSQKKNHDVNDASYDILKISELQMFYEGNALRHHLFNPVLQSDLQ